jgi:hypothetical protein
VTDTDLVEELLTVVTRLLPQTLGELAVEDRLRLAGLERFIGQVLVGLREGLWARVAAHLGAEAEEQARACPCGRRREAQSRPVEVRVLGATTTFPCTYFYCRSCHLGDSPVRRWLGVEHGDTSPQLERSLTDLSARMTFGDAVASLEEQQRQVLDRTQAERITYRVCDEAEAYLAEVRLAALTGLAEEGARPGVPQLQLTADGGAIPVGHLDRPPDAACTDATPRTPVRKLPKGTRSIQGREARLVIVREPEKVTERVVDAHIAPYDHTEFTGERMLAAAARAGLGDQTRIHGVFDMGRWIHSQFEEQFAPFPRTACADISHVAAYLIDAGRQLAPARPVAFGMEHKRRLLDGEVEPVLRRLRRHRCDRGTCVLTDDGECVARVASRYLENSRSYLDYPPILAQELPVGSGEAESGIRHIIKKRLDVAGAWTEDNGKRMLALIALRASGLWDDFWRWRDRRDVDAWHRRQRGQGRSRFRGRPRAWPREVQPATRPPS